MAHKWSPRSQVWHRTFNLTGSGAPHGRRVGDWNSNQRASLLKRPSFRLTRAETFSAWGIFRHGWILAYLGLGQRHARQGHY